MGEDQKAFYESERPRVAEMGITDRIRQDEELALRWESVQRNKPRPKPPAAGAEADDAADGSSYGDAPTAAVAPAAAATVRAPARPCCSPASAVATVHVCETGRARPRAAPSLALLCGDAASRGLSLSLCVFA